MRIAFFGQSGPYAPLALRHLLEQQGEYELVLLVEGQKASSVARQHRLRKAHPPVALPPGEDLNAIGRAAGLPVLQTRDVNAGTAVRTIAEFEPEMIVCVGFDRLFKKAVLETAARGGINAHPSPLPELRGPSPLFWALREGRSELAVTLHALDPKEDHGPVYAMEHYAIPPRAKGDEIYRTAARLAGPMLVTALQRALRGELVGAPQDHSRATRAPRPKPEDACVEPSRWHAEHLVNFCCGVPFFRAAWMRLGSDTFHIRRGLHADIGRRLPAQYLLQSERLVVQCQDGVAHLEIQV